MSTARVFVAAAALLVALAIAPTATLAGSCTLVSACGGPGSTCGNVGNSSSTQLYCEGSSTCLNSSPGSSSYVCVDNNLWKGRACNTDNDCQAKGFTLGSGEFLAYPKCLNNVCARDLLLPNDRCDTNADCRSNSCVSSRCVGNAAGTVCGSSSDCAAGSTCVGGVCYQTVSTGGNCTLSSNLCQFPDTCANNVCVRRYSIAAGAQCFSDSTCGADLTCSSSACALNSATVGAACSSDSECGNGDCGCNRATGQEQCFDDTNKCSSQVQNFNNCGQSNNCHRSSSYSSEGSCIRSNCGTEAESYIICLNNGISRSTYPSACFAGLASPASAVEASLLALF